MSTTPNGQGIGLIMTHRSLAAHFHSVLHPTCRPSSPHASRTPSTTLLFLLLLFLLDGMISLCLKHVCSSLFQEPLSVPSVALQDLLFPFPPDRLHTVSP